LCTLVGAPTSYLRQLPAALSGINLQHGLPSHRAELVKTLEADNGRVELRAVTGPDYGRIWDHELVAAVKRLAPKKTDQIMWRFTQVGEFEYSCLIPGHREAGMIGTIVVK
jgi:plastocyanin